MAYSRDIKKQNCEVIRNKFITENIFRVKRKYGFSVAVFVL